MFQSEGRSRRTNEAVMRRRVSFVSIFLGNFHFANTHHYHPISEMALRRQASQYIRPCVVSGTNSVSSLRVTYHSRRKREEICLSQKQKRLIRVIMVGLFQYRPWRALDLSRAIELS